LAIAIKKIEAVADWIDKIHENNNFKTNKAYSICGY
jgi:hypothetical protein